ncbi:corticoliberin-like [Paramormyrops kingsleyae]|uniref:Corticotropin releasing hormone n=1 Tax=Paramormyrops kingsleyae TaxID=1676925 RepID=A0A3B3S2D2_9TELE|nr:corticoliberin-like [Paramormyrops kingsleyae]
MKLHLLVSIAVLLVAFLPRHECRAIEPPGALPAPAHQPALQQQQHLPLLVRLGEEYFVRLGDGGRSQSVIPATSADATVRKALDLQLTQRLLQSKVDNLSRFVSSLAEPAERGRRSEEPPISLDLTFHLLREVLEMARAEQLAQQAHSNRKMMEIIGK